MIDTVHLVYPHGDASSCPDAIGRHLGALLQVDFEVILHDWDSRQVIPASRSAALVGHAHPHPRTCFRRSAARSGWGRVVLLEPFTTNPRQVGFLRNVVPRCDRFLALTGPWWESQIADSPVRGWLPRMSRVDLAVDRDEFPVLRTEAQPPGGRRLVYIGGDSPYKNLDYLDTIAARLTPGAITWIGPGLKRLRNVERVGPLDFQSSAARSIISTFDFLITVGHSDANPATILEAMAWGLIPMATPTSGYGGTPGVIELPNDDPVEAASRVTDWCGAPGIRLAELRSRNWTRLDEHYNWPRLAAEVRAAILEESSRPELELSPSEQIALRWGEARHRGELTLGAIPRLGLGRLMRWRRDGSVAPDPLSGIAAETTTDRDA